MATSKRPAEVPEPPDERSKRMRNSSEKDSRAPFTSELLCHFTRSYDTKLEADDFVMLCAYPCALLGWGYSIHVRDMDAFVLLHHTFLETLPAFEERQCDSATWCIPAYHEWFASEITAPSCRKGLESQILVEAALRKVGQENPCVFKIALMSLDYVQATRPEEI